MSFLPKLLYLTIIRIMYDNRTDLVVYLARRSARSNKSPGLRSPLREQDPHQPIEHEQHHQQHRSTQQGHDLQCRRKLVCLLKKEGAGGYL
jgi:hypothetical protein